jgi:signal transduction histidine kinase
MSIKFKLLLSYAAMLIIPVLLTIISAVVLLGHYSSQMHLRDFGPNVYRALTEKAVEVYVEIQQTAVKDPDKFLDNKYLDELDSKVNIVNTGIAVQKGDKIIYLSKFLSYPEFYDKLTKYNTKGEGGRELLVIQKKPYNILKNEFNFSDKTPGKVYIITDISPIGQFFGNYFMSLSRTVLIIFILTNVFLTFLVSRSILRPLKQLKYGTEQIKAGNLNFKMVCDSRDEIGDVCKAFEKMREKLKESIDTQIKYEENRKELISNISHDLKTPITSIKGYVDGIMDGVADSPEKMDKYIKTIYAKAADMDRLIDDLFLFSKLDLNKIPFNFEKVDINEYFKDCIDELKFDLEKKNIQLKIKSILTQNTIVLADREKLKRVVLNVIDNASKHAGIDNGVIEIRLIDEADKITVEIRDNGLGINKEDLPYIFDRFYRADHSRNTSAGGSGLGLAIAKQIVEGHRGRIWAQSEEGMGTGIFFTFKKVL